MHEASSSRQIAASDTQDRISVTYLRITSVMRSLHRLIVGYAIRNEMAVVLRLVPDSEVAASLDQHVATADRIGGSHGDKQASR